MLMVKMQSLHGNLANEERNGKLAELLLLQNGSLMAIETQAAQSSIIPGPGKQDMGKPSSWRCTLDQRPGPRERLRIVIQCEKDTRELSTDSFWRCVRPTKSFHQGHRRQQHMGQSTS